MINDLICIIFLIISFLFLINSGICWIISKLFKKSKQDWIELSIVSLFWFIGFFILFIIGVCIRLNA